MALEVTCWVIQKRPLDCLNDFWSFTKHPPCHSVMHYLGPWQPLSAFLHGDNSNCLIMNYYRFTRYGLRCKKKWHRWKWLMGRYCPCSSTWLSVNSIDLNPVTAFKCMNSSFPLKLQVVGKHYNITEESWRVLGNTVTGQTCDWNWWKKNLAIK